MQTTSSIVSRDGWDGTGASASPPPGGGPAGDAGADPGAPPGLGAPKVSVVVPAYKAEATIGRAIAGIAAQSFTDLEVIVVDDASPDATAERARDALRAAGLRHVVVRLDRNAGPSTARNAGVVLARGEYVAFQDADDAWMPDKLARQVAVMDADPRVTLCGCQADLVDPEGTRIGPLFRDLPPLLPQGWKVLLWNACVQTSCAVVRRADLGTQPFDPSLRVAEDRDLWIRLATNGAVALVQEPLVRKVESPTSFMAGNQALIASDTRRMIEFHVRAMRDHLTRRERMTAYGCLHSHIGKGLATQPGQYVRGARHLLLAAVMGFRAFDNARHAVLSAPPVRSARAALGLHRRPRPRPATV